MRTVDLNNELMETGCQTTQNEELLSREASLKNKIPVIFITPVTMDTFLSRNKMHRLLPITQIKQVLTLKTGRICFFYLIYL